MEGGPHYQEAGSINFVVSFIRGKTQSFIICDNGTNLRGHGKGRGNAKGRASSRGHGSASASTGSAKQE